MLVFYIAAMIIPVLNIIYGMYICAVEPLGKYL
jgi:hypothetical protein